MVIVTRSRSGITTLLGKPSKPGITKRTKNASPASTRTRTTTSTMTRKKITATKPSAAPPPSTTIPPPPLPTTNATTTPSLDLAISHLLSVDPSLSRLISAQPPCPLFSTTASAPTDPFESLTSSIISQQVSSAAARSIKSRFNSLFPSSASTSPFPTPAQVHACPHDLLRSAGLSSRKADYVRSLAAHFLDGRLSVEKLSAGTDEEVVDMLVQVHGLGVWSAQMFLMFGLRRMDVFSVGDLGIQRGMAVHFGKLKKGAKVGKGKWKYMAEEEMVRLSEAFRPYRSLFMWYMWRVGEVGVDAFVES